MFESSKSTVQKARGLKAEKGTIELPESGTGGKLDKDSVHAVVAFYSDNKNKFISYPVRKIVLAVGKAIHYKATDTEQS